MNVKYSGVSQNILVPLKYIKMPWSIQNYIEISWIALKHSDVFEGY